MECLKPQVCIVLYLEQKYPVYGGGITQTHIFFIKLHKKEKRPEAYILGCQPVTVDTQVSLPGN